MSTDVDVWWGETRVATVANRRGQMTTTFASATAPMLTVAMPPRTSAYGERQSRPFFHGLLPEGETRSKIAALSPVYDILSTTALGDDLSTAVGLIVDGETNIHRITPTHLVNEAVAWGIRRARATDRVGALLERLPDAIEAAADQHPDAPGHLVDHLTERAEQARTAFTCPANTMTGRAPSTTN